MNINKQLKSILIFLILLISIGSKAQDSINKLIIGTTIKNILDAKNFYDISSNDESVCHFIGENEVPKNNKLILLGTVKCSDENKWYYKANYKNEYLLIDTSFIKVETTSKQKLFGMDDKQHLQYIELFEKYTFYQNTLDTLNAIKEYEKARKTGLIILDYNVFDESEVTDGTGFEITVYNTSTKRIKYISINYIGYNQVDDPVNKLGKSVLTLKGIGPIEPDNYATYNKNYAWFTDIVEYSKISSITVQYFDGTSKIYKSPSANIISKSTRNILQIQ